MSEGGMRFDEETKRFLELVRDRQPQALEICRAHGFVFDDLDDRWQKLAFSFYTDLCELSSHAKNLLETGQDDCVKEVRHAVD